MTDLHRLQELLNDFGVEYTRTEAEGRIEIACEEGRAGVLGYCHFFTVFQFSEAGRFEHMGAYE
jgi:hypothetical protein